MRDCVSGSQVTREAQDYHVQGSMARPPSSWNFIQGYSSRNSRVLAELVCRETANKDEEEINAEKMEGESLGF